MKPFLFIIALLALVSCRKNKIEYARIFIADYEYVTVEGEKTFVSGSLSHPKYLRFDLDQDGVFDMQFESSSSATTGQGVAPLLSVQSLHPGCEFLVESYEDTVYFYETTQVQPDPNGTTASIHLMKYSCNKENALYVANSLATRKELVPLIVGDRLNLEDNFEAGTIYLTGPNQHAVSEANTINDTTFYEVTTYKNVCHTFPTDKIYYIGVRLETVDGPKLGWVKLQYLGDSAMRFFEWALQK